MTAKANAGESRGGEGGGRSPTTGDIARLVSQNLASEDREPAEILVQRVTGGIYMVHVRVHGEPESEAYMLDMGDQKWTERGPS